MERMEPAGTSQARGNGGRNGTRGAARGSYAVGDERRVRILDAAVEHFAQWGFHASSLARIARDVGITQGGLLHHFRSKEDLLVQVLERTEEQDKERFFAEEFGSAAGCYAALLRLTEHNAARLGRTRMFNVLAAEAGDPAHPAHAYFVRRYAELREVMSATLERAVESGELRAGTDVAAMVEETTAVMDGFQLQWVLDPRGFDMVGRFRAYADRLLRAVTTAGTGLPSA
ncbi:TetR/AcrR family transcriptional regulator [Streptomyces sp. NPDC001595]|uniref:TetR/AcrR family transcriptional regulator n=1 Tax=Streptomyces sp. NPDC001532 TaxID=3154520 RepID=UPI0033282B47